MMGRSMIRLSSPCIRAAAMVMSRSGAYVAELEQCNIAHSKNLDVDNIV